MNEQQAFEKHWTDKLSAAVEEISSLSYHDIMQEDLSGLETVSPERKITWSRSMVNTLIEHAAEENANLIMAHCACRYPTENLLDVRSKYQETGQIEDAHAMLVAKFTVFLKDQLGFSEEEIPAILDAGWGMPGKLQGNTIIATKIPKSRHLREYLMLTDPEEKRAIYCHCPRVRDAVKMGETLPVTYCYCGAGYYKGIWEDIIEEEVQVEVIESVLAGGDTCRIKITLPG